MKKRRLNKINIKSESGFTMQDLVAALIIILIFVGSIGSLIYMTFKSNIETKISGLTINYAIKILEDIDKIGYDNVQNGMEQNYIQKFSIPSNFKLSIEVSNYDAGNNKEDLIKKVKLKITCNIMNISSDYIVNKIKIKEI